ncbi:MAG: hypothetical protein KKD44_17265 [Proteobacteria bacterium]|nr:hypothetical protein [Pseudomonadota bacterium]
MRLVPTILTIWAVLIIPGISLGLGQGMTYPIAEKDALEEIREKAATIDWAKAISREDIEKKVKAYKPADLVDLPTAQKTRTFSVNMSYTLEFDIPDPRGYGILYPKGYTFNPLNYMRFDGILVVLNGSRKKQVDWFAHSEYSRDLNTKVLITDGSYYDLSHQLERPVFYAVSELINRFGIQHLPSVVRQKPGSTVMNVTEIGGCHEIP